MKAPNYAKTASLQAAERHAAPNVATTMKPPSTPAPGGNGVAADSRGNSPAVPSAPPRFAPVETIPHAATLPFPNSMAVPRQNTVPDSKPEAPNSIRASCSGEGRTSDASALNFDRQATRVGKIARLPAEIREFVNQYLRGGHRYNEIVEELQKRGYPGISERNISNWKLGGYIDWLCEQQSSEARLALPKALERCVRSGEIDRIQQNALALAADQFMLIMSQFNHRRALELLYEKPELFPRYIAGLASLARCSTELAKAFDVTQNREAAVRQLLATQPADDSMPAASAAESADELDETPTSASAPEPRPLKTETVRKAAEAYGSQ